MIGPIALISAAPLVLVSGCAPEPKIVVVAPEPPLTPIVEEGEAKATWEEEVRILRSVVIPGSTWGDKEEDVDGYYWLLELENISDSTVYFVTANGVAKDSGGRPVETGLEVGEFVIHPGQRVTVLSGEIYDPPATPVSVDASLSSYFSRGSLEGEEGIAASWKASNIDFLRDSGAISVRADFTNPLPTELDEMRASAWCLTSDGVEVGVMSDEWVLSDAGPLAPGETFSLLLDGYKFSSVVVSECFVSVVEETS